MATYSSILAWRIPMDIGGLGGYSFWGHRVQHNWATKHSTAWQKHTLHPRPYCRMLKRGLRAPLPTPQHVNLLPSGNLCYLTWQRSHKQTRWGKRCQLMTKTHPKCLSCFCYKYTFLWVLTDLYARVTLSIIKTETISVTPKQSPCSFLANPPPPSLALGNHSSSFYHFRLELLFL